MPESFVSELRDLGLEPGDIVLMHSSMKALGTKMPPEAFLEDILSVLGPQGTLLLPALTYENVSAQQPLFSVRTSEPCIGLLPRAFFHMKGVVRSLHPTHSVCALGKMAKELTAQHALDDTPVGPHSPFMLLKAHGGKLLFVGDVLGKNTFMHGIEEIAKTPYTLSKERTRYIIEDYDDNQTLRDMITHDFKGWEQEYQRVRNVLPYPAIRTGKVGEADSTLIDAAALAQIVLEKLAGDPYYFVSKSEE
ncbi:MAG: AAC(3) family N-acetyltransferase [Clostridia bacterium]|nr:AAC(3) family N-acetyltransferase [Clostridia bacterium]